MTDRAARPGGEDADPLRSRLRMLAGVVERFDLRALGPLLDACRALAEPDAPLDVAVLGQFKSGKSSMLNAILGADLLPVGVLPVTAAVTRLRAGPALRAAVTRTDGSTVPVPVGSLAEYVSEAGNPGNAKGVSAADIETPALADLPGVRLVDTPGLGSAHAHNTRSTMDWLPRVGAALLAMSVERPMSEEDRRLVELLRPVAPRLVVILTKADLVTGAELEQVRLFVASRLREALGREPLIVPFSIRRDAAARLDAIRRDVLMPVARRAGAERDAALAHKLTHLAGAARQYLTLALHAAERTAHDREALRAAVLDESVKESLLDDELALASDRLAAAARPALDRALRGRREAIEARLRADLDEMRSWRGHIGRQAARYEAFMRERLTAELDALASDAAPVVAGLLGEAEQRFRRIIEAFRDRLGRNVTRAAGVVLSPLEWTPPPPPVVAPPVAVERAFMTHWDLFWWLIPMRLFGWLFRRHCRAKVEWEVWMNLRRLVSAWSEAAADGIEALRTQAAGWARAELATLRAALERPSEEAEALRDAIARLDALAAQVPEGDDASDAGRAAP